MHRKTINFAKAKQATTISMHATTNIKPHFKALIKVMLFILIILPAMLGILGSFHSSILEDLFATFAADNHYHSFQVTWLW